MNKRGLSTVVTVLIILLLTIVALSILWFFVKDYILDRAELIKDREKFFTEEFEILELKVEDKQFNITLRKTGGEIETTKETVEVSIGADIFSVIDLSGSMCWCNDAPEDCCIDMDGSWSNDSHCEGVDPSLEDVCTNICYGVFGWGRCRDINFNLNPTPVTCCINDLGGTWVEDSSCWGTDLGGEAICTACGGIFVDRITPTQIANRRLVDTTFQEESIARMGFVAYDTVIIGEERGSLFTLTNDATKLKDAITLWEAHNQTCICCGINEATLRFKEQSDYKIKTMIVMSDGFTGEQCDEQGVTGDLDNNGEADTAADDAIQAAIDAMNELEDLTIYTVGVGVGVDEETLQNIANAVGGEYLSATNIDDLIFVYETIGQRIKTVHISEHSYESILFIFSSATDSYEMISLELPEVLGRKDYSFDLAGKLEGEIIKIEIYPTYILESGREVIGPLMDTWEPDYWASKE